MTPPLYCLLDCLVQFGDSILFNAMALCVTEIEGNLVIDGARGETFVWKGLTKSVTRILKLQAI